MYIYIYVCMYTCKWLLEPKRKETVVWVSIELLLLLLDEMDDLPKLGS